MVGDVAGLATNGSLARTVRDAAALLDAMAGPMPGDPHWAPVPAQSFLSMCDEELGHVVEDIPAFDPRLVPSFETVWSVSAAGAPVDPTREGELRPLTQWLHERGRATSATQFTAALAAMQLASRTAIAATAVYDVVLTPTLAQLPAPVGWFRRRPAGRNPARRTAGGRGDAAAAVRAARAGPAVEAAHPVHVVRVRPARAGTPA